MTVNNDAIQNEMENVVANVEPSFIEKIVNNENLHEFIVDAGIAGGCLYIVVTGGKVIKLHVWPWMKNQYTKFVNWVHSLKKTNPVDELKEVVEAEVVA